MWGWGGGGGGRSRHQPGTPEVRVLGGCRPQAASATPSEPQFPCPLKCEEEKVVPLKIPAYPRKGLQSSSTPSVRAERAGLDPAAGEPLEFPGKPRSCPLHFQAAVHSNLFSWSCKVGIQVQFLVCRCPAVPDGGL